MAIRLGDTAPDFRAQTTVGEINFHEWLRDSWGMLFSHPGDFTPVCTTELGEVARLEAEFARREVKVIGLSVDTLGEHRAWAADIEETEGVALNFPLIADVDRKIARLYGMLQDPSAETLTVRTVFIIAPDKTVALTLTYPASTGRNFSEILRALDSLQLTSNFHVATPVNWRHGHRVLVDLSLDDENARQQFGAFEASKPYLRYVDDPDWIG